MDEQAAPTAHAVYVDHLKTCESCKHKAAVESLCEEGQQLYRVAYQAVADGVVAVKPPERWHRCMRCHEEFLCEHGPLCKAEYDVLPNVITHDQRIKDHCPQNPDWAWVRGYGSRMRAQGHIDAARARMNAYTPDFPAAAPTADQRPADDERHEEADRVRLEVLMQHPDKLWIDGSGAKLLYSGVDDGTCGRGIWHTDPRRAVDDIVRRVAGENK